MPNPPATVVKVMAGDLVDDAIWLAKRFVSTTRMEMMEASLFPYHSRMYFDLTQCRYVIDDSALIAIDLWNFPCAWI